jgi:intracellular multiplication protein IcmE
MNEKENFEETVEIPESSPEDFSSRAAKKGLSPAVKFGLVIAGVFVFIGVSFIMSGDENVDPTSSISVNADLDATPGGEIQSESPRFQALLEEANEEAAQAAIEQERSFIPTPERILEPIDDLQAGVVEEELPSIQPLPEPEPEPVVEVVAPRPVITPPPAPVVAAAPAPAPTPSQSTTTEQQENPYTSAMISQMGTLARSANQYTSLVVESTVTEEGEGVINGSDQVSASQDGVSTQVASASQLSEEADIVIPAGKIIYAETITSTNSDASGSPVLVELTTGEFRGSRLIGGFTVNDVSDRMVIQFTTMTMPDETSVAINAYAVDGMTAETSVASSVDRRYLSRYGAILASSFITSFAEAKSEAAQTLTTIGDEVAVVQDTRDEEQSLYAGLSAAASAIGEDLADSAPDGPRVNLAARWPLAILFMEPVVAAQ